MVHNYQRTGFAPLEERIRAAGAERGVELGYRIGDAIAKIAETIDSLLMPKREPLDSAHGPFAHLH